MHQLGSLFLGGGLGAMSLYANQIKEVIMKKFYKLLLIISLFSSSSFYSQTFEVGDVIKVGEQLHFSVEEDGKWNSYNEFLGPERGNIYYYVLVYIKNISYETISYNRLYFSLKDSKGFSYSPNFYGPEPGISIDDLLPNDIVRGYVSFQISQNSDGLKLYYGDSIWGSGSKVIVKLSR